MFSWLRRQWFRLYATLCKLFGSLDFFWAPMFLVYTKTFFKLDGKDFDQISKAIKKNDVLIRRIDRNIGSKFIPGFYKHAAVALNSVDVNTDIIHAVEAGVVPTTLFDFMQADSIAIFRPKFPISGLEDRVQKALGKSYDYTFNEDNTNRFFCTELVAYLLLGENVVVARTTTLAGSKVMVPDAFFDDSRFELILEIRK